MRNQISACGKLVYSDYALYEIISPTGALNISKILDKVYYSNNNKMSIKIMSGSKTLYNEVGNLLKKRGDYGIYDYHINGFNLEEVLFMNSGKNVDVEIYADVLDQPGIGDSGVYDREQTRICAK